MEKIKIGINGFGRIGSLVLDASLERENVQVVAINDLLEVNYIAYMLKYDSVHGQFKGTIEVKDNNLVINGNTIRVTAEQDPANLKWDEVGVDVVVECTGRFLTQDLADKHIQAGAKKVVLSAPPKDDIPMFVMGVNHKEYAGQPIVSNASCTTNCLAPLTKVIHDNFGMVEGLMTTVHAATATQKTVDGPSMKDWRGGRSVFGNIIPSTTGAAKAVGLVIPAIKGKLTGISYRVPVADASVVDLNVKLEKPTSYEDICKKMKEASETYLKGVVEYVDEDLVSSDFIGNSAPTCFDARMGIELNEYWFKLVAFYDNEWGYTANMLRLIAHMGEVDAK